jgi:hypothetical protein
LFEIIGLGYLFCFILNQQHVCRGKSDDHYFVSFCGDFLEEGLFQGAKIINTPWNGDERGDENRIK